MGFHIRQHSSVICSNFKSMHLSSRVLNGNTHPTIVDIKCHFCFKTTGLCTVATITISIRLKQIHVNFICSLNLTYKLDWFEKTIVLVVIHSYLHVCHRFVINKHSLKRGPSWSWSYDSWIYNYLCIWPLTLWVRILLMARVLDKTLYYKVCY